MNVNTAPLAISIVVPTRNRPDALERCLLALAAQRDVGYFEIIVVDDGSTDADGVSAVVGSQPLARLVRAGGHGPAAARNAGAAAATARTSASRTTTASPSPTGL